MARRKGHGKELYCDVPGCTWWCSVLLTEEQQWETMAKHKAARHAPESFPIESKLFALPAETAGPLPRHVPALSLGLSLTQSPPEPTITFTFMGAESAFSVWCAGFVKGQSGDDEASAKLDAIRAVYQDWNDGGRSMYEALQAFGELLAVRP